MAVTGAMAAQGVDTTRLHVTPVQPATNVTLTPPKGTNEKVIERYLAGDTTSARAQERKDSLRRVYTHYPLLTSLDVSVNVGDVLLAAFGQHYGGLDVGATLNMWNRVQPVLELGMGMAKDTPEDLNFTYKGKLSPYARLGVNYNFLFKKDPRYRFVAGVRLGASTYKFDVSDVTVTSPYWDEAQQFSLTGRSGRALWGEFLAGIMVELTHRVSVGWQVKYHGLFGEKKDAQAQAWYIPGYGARGKRWAFALQVAYTIPLHSTPVAGE